MNPSNSGDDCRTIVQAGRDLALGHTIRATLVRSDPPGNETLAFYQLDWQPFCGPHIPFAPKGFFPNDTVLVDGAPEPELVVRHFHDGFTKMPDITGPSRSPDAAFRSFQMCNA